MPDIPSFTVIDPEIEQALAEHKPIVALESTIITHGLPYPQNLALAQDMENEIRGLNALPATIAVLDGRVRVGLKNAHLERLAGEKDPRKISGRDIGPAVALKQTGGTTVAGTLVLAQAAGIRIFATGGIGGVHRDAPTDISADLLQLAHSPLIVVCAGAKAILDIPATLEYLETVGVPVIGYQTEDFPAFYSRSSGIKVTTTAQFARQAAQIAFSHWETGLTSAVLVAVPPPEDFALPVEKVNKAVEQALLEAKEKKIQGQAITPFLLERVSKLTGGESLQANLALLKNNARVAAEIAQFLY